MNQDHAQHHAAAFLDPTMRHIEPTAGAIGEARMFVNRKGIDRDARTIEFVCSTATVDRYGEIVEPSAFKSSLPAFLLNPAFPAGHQYEFSDQHTPTVGHWKSMRIDGDKLVGVAWFKPRGLGEEVWLDYLDGNLNSVSVAFIARAWEMRETDLGGTKKSVRVFTDADLLECSAVLIPANPQARLRAAAFAPGIYRGQEGAGAIEAAVKLLQPAVERLITKLLNVERDGPLRTFVLDVADVRGHHAPDDWDDDIGPDADEPNPADHGAGDGDDAQLAELLGKAIDASRPAA